MTEKGKRRARVTIEMDEDLVGDYVAAHRRFNGIYTVVETVLVEDQVSEIVLPEPIELQGRNGARAINLSKKIKDMDWEEQKAELVELMRGVLQAQETKDPKAAESFVRLYTNLDSTTNNYKLRLTGEDFRAIVTDYMAESVAFYLPLKQMPYPLSWQKLNPRSRRRNVLSPKEIRYGILFGNLDGKGQVPKQTLEEREETTHASLRQSFRSRLSWGVGRRIPSGS